MVVPPHPHTGLQTVSWLFEGEIEHRDSAGSHELVRPGGEPHDGGARHRALRGLDPDDDRACTACSCGWPCPRHPAHIGPFFEHAETVPVVDRRRRPCACSSARSPGVDAAPTSPCSRRCSAPRSTCRAGGSVELALDPAFEHGVLVDAGPVVIEVDGPDAPTEVAWSDLAYLEPGRHAARARGPGRRPYASLLLGGVPFGEAHRDVVELHRPQPRRDRRVPATVAGRRDRRATTPTAGSAPWTATTATPLPAPELPTVRLKPRRDGILAR